MKLSKSEQRIIKRMRGAYWAGKNIEDFLIKEVRRAEKRGAKRLPNFTDR